MHYLTKHEIGHSLTALCMHKIDKSIIIVLSLFLLLQIRPHSNGQGSDKAVPVWDFHLANFAIDRKNHGFKSRIWYGKKWECKHFLYGCTSWWTQRGILLQPILKWKFKKTVAEARSMDKMSVSLSHTNPVSTKSGRHSPKNSPLLSDFQFQFTACFRPTYSLRAGLGWYQTWVSNSGQIWPAV